MTKLRYNVTKAKPSAAKGKSTREVEAHRLDCPVCDNADVLVVTWKLGRDDEWQWFLHCFSDSCQALGGGYLAEVARATGAPNGWALKEDPLKWLSQKVSCGSASRRNRNDARPVTAGDVYNWRRKLAETADVRAYLMSERGLSTEIIEEYGLGYDGRAIRFPLWEDEDLWLFNQATYRYWPDPWRVDAKGKEVWKRSGAAAALYPHLPPGEAIIVCEGELDTLIGRQHGLPTVTSTTGTSWSVDWNRLVIGKRLAIVYDTGEASLKIARRRAADFRAAGIEAWPVDLGLDAKGEDLTDWFMRYGRSAADLIALIRSERRAAAQAKPTKRIRATNTKE